MQCPLLYRFRVIDRLPQPPSAAAARGTLVHAVLERSSTCRPAAHARRSRASWSRRQWAALLEAEPELAELVDGDDGPGRLAPGRTAATLLERWFNLEDPTRLEPAERELYVETDLDGLVLRGYVDRLDVAPGGRGAGRRLQDGALAVRAVREQGAVPDEVLRPGAVALHGVVPAMLQLVYLGNGEIVRYAPDEADLLATERKLKALWAGDRAGGRDR